MSSKRYNVGIIGYGWVSGAHIAAINATPHAQVTAVCSSRPLDAAQVSAQHGGAIKCFNNLDEMLKDPAIHVVSVCSYPQDHARHAVAAAKAGKHLIIEKPLALKWDDCLAIQKAVQDAGVKTCVCFECRFSSQFLIRRARRCLGRAGRSSRGSDPARSRPCLARRRGD